MTRCVRCGTEFVPSGRRRYCSDACKQADWRARQAPAQLGPDQRNTERPVCPEHTVYECPQCDTRYLGARRCEECNLFCRRIGPGGLCPHCDEPVAYDDLA
jgi:hypothetical protein